MEKTHEYDNKSSQDDRDRHVECLPEVASVDFCTGPRVGNHVLVYHSSSRIKIRQKISNIRFMIITSD